MAREIIGTIICPICGKEVEYDERVRDVYYCDDDCVAARTYDCHGIPFRVVCIDCYEKIMDEKGFDGEVYTEFDEQIEPDY